MERKIGEIFKYNGEWYQCVESDSCGECSLFTTECGSSAKSDLADKVVGLCSKVRRTDNKYAIFKKLEKVGEPYIIGNKLIQRYKMYPTTYHINVYGWYYHNLDVKSWTIDIEVKQNREDMSNTETLWYGPDKKEAKSLKLSNLKPFSLEAAKAGKPVCTRDGHKARIICFDRKDNTPIVALIECDNHAEILQCVYNDGKCFHYDTSNNDLMMLPEKKEGWVNLYKERIYSTKEEAIEATYDAVSYVDTVKVSWEE